MPPTTYKDYTIECFKDNYVISRNGITLTATKSLEEAHIWINRQHNRLMRKAVATRAASK